MATSNTPQNTRHRSLQWARNADAILALGKVRSQLEDLVKNPESIVAWEVAEGNAATLLKIICEAVGEQRMKRIQDIEREFNSKKLFSEVGR